MSVPGCSQPATDSRSFLTVDSGYDIDVVVYCIDDFVYDFLKTGHDLIDAVYDIDVVVYCIDDFVYDFLKRGYDFIDAVYDTDVSVYCIDDFVYGIKQKPEILFTVYFNSFKAVIISSTFFNFIFLAEYF